MRLFLNVLSYIGLGLVLLTLALPASARTTSTSNAARIGAMTAANSAAQQQSQINTQTAMGFGIASMAEVSGQSACMLDDIAPEHLDSAKVVSDDLAQLAWAVEKATAFGTDFSRITLNQLMMVRGIQTRVATKSSRVNYLSIHEALVLCDMSLLTLDRNIVQLRGRE